MKAIIKSAQVSTLGLVLCLLIVFASNSFAGSATWKSSPATGDWNTATNWTPQTVPNGVSDVATFATSNQTAVSLSSDVALVGIEFNSGASAFTITIPGGLNLSFNADAFGIRNNSGIAQNFVNRGRINFTGSATTGFTTATPTFNNKGVGLGSAVIAFDQNSNAEIATFINSGDDGIDGYGITVFRDNSRTDFARLIANAGLNFGGQIVFKDDSVSAYAVVKLFGSGAGDLTDGNLDISAHNSPGISVASLEGSGTVFLGSNSLGVVPNTRFTAVFSGVIVDGGRNGGTGGRLAVGNRARLVLSRAGGSTYTGGTNIDGRAGCALLVKNKSGSATGSGPVQVFSGTLGGTGIISGAVTIGNGTTTGAILLPGTAKKPGTLTINNTLTFNSPATYKCALNRTSSPPAMAKVKALGVTINSEVTFTLNDPTTGALTAGTSFTVINNTSANPIFGTFSNLADGGTITSGGTTFKANYHGGTGNDLTLTVQ